MVLKTDGSLWGMGKNSDGQLGHGSTTDRWTPALIESSGVIEISAGGMHSLYLKRDGSLWGMGKNNRGQLGQWRHERSVVSRSYRRFECDTNFSWPYA